MNNPDFSFINASKLPAKDVVAKPPKRSVMVRVGGSPGMYPEHGYYYNWQPGSIPLDPSAGTKGYSTQMLVETIAAQYPTKGSINLGPAQGVNLPAPVTVVEDRLRELIERIANLQKEIELLKASQRFVVALTTLSPYPFELMQPISLVLESDGQEFTATFFEANVSASGDTEADAIDNFKDSVTAVYQILEGTQSDRLGPLPARQWSILQKVIRRV